MKSLTWFTHLSQLPCDLSLQTKNWIEYPTSMTTRVKKHFQQVEIQRLQHRRDKMHAEEARFLEIPTRTAVIVREIEMCCDKQPWLSARTIMPYDFFIGKNRRLLTLGNQAIGRILLGNSEITREPLSFSLINPTVFFMQTKMMTSMPDQLLPARRSVFCYKNHRLLLTEVFNPKMLEITGSKISL